MALAGARPVTRSREGMRLAVQLYSGSNSPPGTAKLITVADDISGYLASCPPEVRPDGSVVGVFDTIIGNEEMIMSGLTDLQAAITAMQAEWSTFLADLTSALANEDSDAAVEAAAQLVQQQTQAIAAEDAIVNPPASTSAPAAPAS
jgi:hypothetical protein